MSDEDIGNQYTKVLSDYAEQTLHFDSEVERLQSLCTHSKYEVAYYSWRAGSTSLLRICKFCGKTMGKPSADELAEFKRAELQIFKEEWAANHPNEPFPEEIIKQSEGFYI